jgi:hypothetical protein
LKNSYYNLNWNSWHRLLWLDLPVATMAETWRRRSFDCEAFDGFVGLDGTLELDFWWPAKLMRKRGWSSLLYTCMWMWPNLTNRRSWLGRYRLSFSDLFWAFWLFQAKLFHKILQRRIKYCRDDIIHCDSVSALNVWAQSLELGRNSKTLPCQSLSN